MQISRPARCYAARWGAFLFLLMSSARPVPAALPATEVDKNQAENAAIRREWDSWNHPFKPFHIIGNVYYVGPAGISSFLIVTPAGNILLDTGFESTVPGICQSITNLGFRVPDVKIILNTHAHLDHAGGDALMKRLTAAKIFMSAADASLLADGGMSDFTPYSREMVHFRPTHADQLLRDGDVVSLGGVRLVCHLTPGHTKGCTTWTMEVNDHGRIVHVLFFGSTSLLPGVRLLNNPRYPQIVTDYQATFCKLKTLPCDVFLAPHAGFFDLAGKAARLERGETPNPFIDPSGYQNFIRQSEQKFLDQWHQEQAGAPAMPPPSVH